MSERLLMLGSSVNGESTRRGVSPSSVVLLISRLSTVLYTVVLYCTVVLCWYVS